MFVPSEWGASVHVRVTEPSWFGVAARSDGQTMHGGVSSVPQVGQGGVSSVPHVGHGGVSCVPQVGQGGVSVVPQVGQGGAFALPQGGGELQPSTQNVLDFMAGKSSGVAGPFEAPTR